MEELKDRAAFFSRCRQLVIKVGSAVLTGPQGLNRVMIHRLSDQIAELRQLDPERKIAIVTSGRSPRGCARSVSASAPAPFPTNRPWRRLVKAR